MARLISEDEQVKSSIELVLLKDQIQYKPNISWIPYEIILNSGNKKLLYKKEKGNNGSGDYVFSLKPVNEVENMLSGIESFLISENKTLFSFEPIEPSFELSIEKSFRGFSISCWLDAGNVISDHYTWDGFGIRFFTNKDKIFSFVQNLKKEEREIMEICQEEPT